MCLVFGGFVLPFRVYGSVVGVEGAAAAQSSIDVRKSVGNRVRDGGFLVVAHCGLEFWNEDDNSPM